MPNRITVEFVHLASQEYWTNRYFTTTAVDAAGTVLDAIAAAHRNILASNCILTKIRIDDNVQGTDNFDTVSKNAAGLVATGGGDMLPLWVTARVDFDVAGGGRASRKYLRGIVGESAVDFTTLSSGLITLMNTFGDAIIAVGTICDPQGNLFVDAVPWPSPQMRQLRRGSKKNVTP